VTEQISEEKTAVISYTDKGVKIHIGTLTIDLVADADNPGPLGHPEQDPGVIFWQSEYAGKTRGSFEHGTQRPLGFENLRKSEVEEIIEEVQGQ